jgi:hypothetical protein
METAAAMSASASLADKTFLGEVQNGEVKLVLSSNFDWADGCRWETVQKIYGQLSTGGLTYTYVEAPLAGQQGCSSSCSATGGIRITR